MADIKKLIELACKISEDSNKLIEELIKKGNLTAEYSRSISYAQNTIENLSRKITSSETESIKNDQTRYNKHALVEYSLEIYSYVVSVFNEVQNINNNYLNYFGPEYKKSREDAYNIFIDISKLSLEKMNIISAIV